jgi:hypothetical protein
MSYVTDFICTYKLMDDEFGQDYLYRAQLLQAFGLDKWDEDEVSIIMDNTYTKIKAITVFRELFEAARKNKEIDSLIKLIYAELGQAHDELGQAHEELGQAHDDNKLVFELLFKYEFFDMTHKCLSEYLREGRVKEETRITLLKSVELII